MMVATEAADAELIGVIERGELCLREGEAAEDLTQFKASFPTPCAAMANIMDTP